MAGSGWAGFETAERRSDCILLLHIPAFSGAFSGFFLRSLSFGKLREEASLSRISDRLLNDYICFWELYHAIGASYWQHTESAGQEEPKPLGVLRLRVRPAPATY